MFAVTIVVAAASLLTPASAGSSSCDISQYWANIAGALSWVSSGDAGVWGVNSAAQIFYREGTYVGSTFYSYDGRNYGYSHPDGTSWILVAGSLTQIDVGKNSVWGTYSGNVYYRSGITPSTPTGTGWVSVTGLSATQVSVSDVDGKVWAVQTGTGYVYRRVGISDELPGGLYWEYVSGITVRYVDVGAAGVWATTAAGAIYYRVGSRHDCQGSSWQLVPGTLNQVVSGGDVVWGMQATGSTWFRLGITSTNPTGTEWIQVPGSQGAQISVCSTNNAVWALDTSHNIYTRHP